MGSMLPCIRATAGSWGASSKDQRNQANSNLNFRHILLYDISTATVLTLVLHIHLFAAQGPVLCILFRRVSQSK